MPLPRFAFCNEKIAGLTPDEICALFAEAGCGGVEFAPYSLRTSDTPLNAGNLFELVGPNVEPWLIAMRTHGIVAEGLHWLLAQSEGAHITSADPAKRLEAENYLTALVHLCDQMGGRVLVFGSPGQRNLEPGVDFTQGIEYACQVFTRPAKVAADLGIKILIEPLGRSETDFVNSAAEGMILVEAMGNHPGFGLHLDTKALFMETNDVAADVAARIREYGVRAGHFHVTDSNLGAPGSGDRDFRPICEAIAESGYTGAVSVEVFVDLPDPVAAVRGSMDYLRRCWPE